MTTKTRFVGGDSYAPLTDQTVRSFLSSLPSVHGILGGTPTSTVLS